jgi:hypothetical protein
MSPGTQKLINFALFQVGWLACVLAAANKLPVISVISVVVILAAHFILIGARKSEIVLLAAATLIGAVIDSINFQIGALRPAAASAQTPIIAPIWLISLWPLFASTLNHSLNWLKNQMLLAGMLGAVFAPVAYYAGTRLGALSLNNESLLFSLLVIACEWAIITPLLVGLSQRFNSQSQAVASESNHA